MRSCVVCLLAGRVVGSAGLPFSEPRGVRGRCQLRGVGAVYSRGGYQIRGVPLLGQASGQDRGPAVLAAGCEPPRLHDSGHDWSELRAGLCKDAGCKRRERRGRRG